jgi:DNA adenine methylase
MPYTIKKVQDGYKVCKKDEPNTCFSKKGLSEEKAKKQEKAIIMSELEGGAVVSDPELYEKIKAEIYAKNPKHSAYRSMQIVKAYKDAGGKYEDDGKRDTKKWLGQKWTSVNDYYHNGEVVPCGNSDTQEKFGEYPLCRPLKIIKELSKNQMKKMIDEKKDKSPLITSNVLGTDKFNIKNTVSGGLKPLTARVGGKVLLKKKIVDDYFPSPSTYSTYVEPFVGGGSVYFYKNKDNHKEVINDIDPDIMRIFEGFKKYPASKIAQDVNGDYSEKDFNKILESSPSNDYAKFLRTFLLYKLSYFGRGLSFGKPRINSKFTGYQERLEDVDLFNTDYKEIIKKYNKPSTFFYLDPPARESSGNYRFSSIDIPELLKILKTIKGKFLLSLADIDIKKKEFQPFKIISVPTKYVGTKTRGGQTLKVKEYLIMNYEPRMEGGMLKRLIENNLSEDRADQLIKHVDTLKSEDTDKIKKVARELFEYAPRNNQPNTASLRANLEFAKNADPRSMIGLNGLKGALSGGMQITKDSVTIPKDEFIKEHKRLVKFFSEEAKDQGEELNKVMGKGMCGGCMGKCGGAVSEFQEKLSKIGLAPKQYLKQAKIMAEKTGYDSDKVVFCNTGKNKLMYESPDKSLVHFGNPDYPDYIIYSWLEHKGEVEKGTADKRRELYRARATKIKGDWKKNKYSANNLAINILW